MIFGGSGFIGRNLYLDLSKKNKNIYIFDKVKPTKIKYESKNLIIGDILNTKLVLKSLKKIDTIIHLAAHGGVLKSIQEPKKNLENNILGTLNILEAARVNRVKKIIFASSGGTIAGNTVKKLTENTLPNPVSQFGVSKLACEKYCNVYSNLYGIVAINLRFSNVYGPFSEGKNNFINNLIESTLLDKKMFINGDGTQSRDFIYVDDIVNAIKKGLSLNESNTFQIGSGNKTSLNKVIKYVYKYNKTLEKKILYRPSIKGEVKSVISDIAKSQMILKFKYKVRLKDGIKLTYDWYKKNIYRL